LQKGVVLWCPVLPPPPPRIIYANRRCWNVSGKSYGMLVKQNLLLKIKKPPRFVSRDGLKKIL
jgi:hypothetical protein